jgi:Cytochrome C oxidase, cbb3-type, subunit III
MRPWLLFTVLIIIASPGKPETPENSESRGSDDATSEQIFGGYCLQCHGVVPRAPAPDTLRRMSADNIYDALTAGAMKDVGAQLTERQKWQLSEWATGAKLGTRVSGDAKEMSNRCSNFASSRIPDHIVSAVGPVADSVIAPTRQPASTASVPAYEHTAHCGAWRSGCAFHRILQR